MKLALIILVVALLAAAAWPYGNTSETRLSVFMATDSKSKDSGLGAALSRLEGNMTDLSYMDVGKFTLAQLSQLSPKQIGPFNAYFGFATGFAKADDASIPGTPNGWFSGLELVLEKVDLSYGLSLDLRASSLSKDFDPIAWFSDPDILALGAGLSFKF